MSSAKLKPLGAKKAVKPAAKKAAMPAKKAPRARAIVRSANSDQFVVYDTPLEPKHTTRQRIVEAIAKAAAA